MDTRQYLLDKGWTISYYINYIIIHRGDSELHIFGPRELWDTQIPYEVYYQLDKFAYEARIKELEEIIEEMQDECYSA